jgi:hypothetical protein
MASLKPQCAPTRSAARSCWSKAQAWGFIPPATRPSALSPSYSWSKPMADLAEQYMFVNIPHGLKPGGLRLNPNAEALDWTP